MTNPEKSNEERIRRNRETVLLYVGRISRLLDESARLNIDDEESARLLDSIYPLLRQVRGRLEK
jgi:hypothetical protein